MNSFNNLANLASFVVLPTTPLCIILKQIPDTILFHLYIYQSLKGKESSFFDHNSTIIKPFKKMIT